MINMKKIEVVEFLDDNRVIVIVDNKKYIRTVKTNIHDQKYIIVNFIEFLISNN